MKVRRFQRVWLLIVTLLQLGECRSCNVVLPHPHRAGSGVFENLGVVR